MKPTQLLTILGASFMIALTPSVLAHVNTYHVDFTDPDYAHATGGWNTGLCETVQTHAVHLPTWWTAFYTPIHTNWEFNADLEQHYYEVQEQVHDDLPNTGLCTGAPLWDAAPYAISGLHGGIGTPEPPTSRSRGTREP